MKEKELKKVIEKFIEEHGEDLSDDVKTFVNNFSEDYTPRKCEINFSFGKKGVQKLVLAGEKTAILAGITTILFALCDRDKKDTLKCVQALEFAVRMHEDE